VIAPFRKEQVMSVKGIRISVVGPAVVVAVSLTGAATGKAQVPEPPAKSEPAPSGWAAVDQIIGREGKVQPGGVYKYSFPRGDLSVVVHGVTVKPALAIGSWVAFEGSGGNAMAMGDLVLTEREVTPVLTKLQQSGV
jgi:hypothetical protein